MMVNVQLFARARELAGAAVLAVELPDGATVAELRPAMSKACPPLAEFLARCAVAVNDDYAGDDEIIAAGASVAVIPPVSGG